MLFASNFILNWCVVSNQESLRPSPTSLSTACVHRATQPGEFEIHPWIHNPSNALSVSDQLRPVAVPDVVPSELLGLDKGNQPDFSMCAGEFLEAYANDKGGRRAACVGSGGSVLGVD